MAEIYIIDDDALLREGFEELLQEEGYDVHTASSGEEALEKLDWRHADCIVMDVRMPGMDGLEVLKAMRSHEECPPILIMTAFGTTATAIQAMKLGAFDYILKPFEIPAMLELIARAVETSRRQREHESQETTCVPQSLVKEELVGSSAPMQEIYKAIGRVASTDTLVLLRGESGTGKELAARSIWQNSTRSEKPFVVINCVAIPDTLLESELFGYERGAFTGAQHARAGRIEQAAGGTVFLDEIGDMPLSVQAKFLRLLQERQIERLGAPNSISVDVRIIAATNVDLERAVQEGRFREDLYYRLKVVTLALPPLRERMGDIPELAQALIARHAAHLGFANPGIEQDALALLGQHTWPGNVRELANLLHKAIVFSGGAPLCAADLERIGFSQGLAPQKEEVVLQTPPLQSQNTVVAQEPSTSEEQNNGALSQEELLYGLIDPLLTAGGDAVFDSCMDLMGRAVVKRALELSAGNRSRAARMLGLSRPTLLARMDKYGLKVETVIS